MKLKGVGTFEQHVEKIVLGAVSVVFLLVVSAQLLLQPRITVGTTQYAPGQAYRPVLDKAAQVQAAMEPREDWDKPTVGEGSLGDEFRAAREAPVAPRSSAVALGERFPMESVIVDAPTRGESAEVAAVVVPAPTAPFPDSYWAALDPGVVVAYPELAKLVPAAQPFDKVFVTVEAMFDGTALAKSLQADPDSSGPVRAIPTSWYREITEIFAVRLEREELAPTGEWTNLTQIPAPPGMTDLVAELAAEGVQDQTQILAFVGDARRSADDIQRPEFYRTIAGFTWLPPKDSSRVYGAGELPAAVERDFVRLTKTQDELNRTEIALEKQRDPGGGRQPPRTGGAGEISSTPPRDTRTAPQTAVQKLEAKIKSLRNDIAALEAGIRAAGFDPETREPLPPPQVTAVARPLLSDPQVRVWAHDLTAQPGKSYRYRVRVGINNPMFGRVAGLIQSQAALAKPPVIWSEPSEWTNIDVQGTELWYVTSASEGDDLGSGARSTVELYRMFYGFYRRGTAALEPGDKLAGDVKLPHQNLLPIYDLEKLKPGAQGPGPGLPPPPPDPRIRPGEGGAGEIISSPTGVPPPPPPPPGELPSDAPPPLPPDAKPWTQPIRVALDVMLVDVGRAAVADSTGLAQTRPPTQAYLRVADGQIVARVPDDDRTQQGRRRAEESARKGETQGAPPPPKPEELLPTGVKPPKPPKPGDGGGGGGGGG